MVIVDYISWHFTIAPGGIWGLLNNYMKATWHRFLIVQHLKTLFAPWHRQQPSDLDGPGGLGAKIMNSIADFYIRILAAGVRSIIIISGLIVEAIIFIAFVLLFIVWILWPIILVYLISRGLVLVF